MFSEWSLVEGSKIKRRDYSMTHLLAIGLWTDQICFLIWAKKLYPHACHRVSNHPLFKIGRATNANVNYNPDVLSCLANLSGDEVFHNL